MISVYGNISSVREGDLIEITGYKLFYNNFDQIIPIQINILSSHNTVSDPHVFDLNWTSDDLTHEYGNRFHVFSLVLHSVEQDTYGNLSFILENMNTNYFYRGRYDSRLPNANEMTEYILSLEDHIVNLENVLLAYDDTPLFMFTNINEIILIE